MNACDLRQSLSRARRIVVKVGTHVLVREDGTADPRRFRALVDQLARLRADGREVVLVSSGAIGMGLQALGLSSRPTALPELQMAAAVGQSRLMEQWGRLFARRGCVVGQVLLTHDDLKHRLRHLNARNTFMALLRHGVVPVVNENDVVAVDEIKFGDNDQLAALVTMLVDADLLVLLSSVDGLQDAPTRVSTGERVSCLPRVTSQTLDLVRKDRGSLSVGGMGSKLLAAQAASEVGAAVVIADGRAPRVLDRILAGEDTGTLIGGSIGGPIGGLGAAGRRIPSRKRWLAYFHKPQGSLVVDAGARAALVKNGKSLLPVGVKAVEGRFEAGSVVAIKGPDGAVFARGLVECASADIERALGERGRDEVIHRDNLVVLEE